MSPGRSTILALLKLLAPKNGIRAVFGACLAFQGSPGKIVDLGDPGGGVGLSDVFVADDERIE